MKVPCRYHMKYPANVEREYIRMTNRMMALMKEVIENNAPNLKRAISDGTRYDSAKDNEKLRKAQRMTNITRTTREIENVFADMKAELERKFGFFHARNELNRIAGLEQKLSIKEFKKACKKTIGLDLRDDYFTGELYDRLMQEWVSDNVELIKTVPFESLDAMKQICFNGYVNGDTTTGILKQIQDKYGMTKRHARLIARDQTGKLNGQISKQQQTSVGVDEYLWDDSDDNRVRARHRELNGHVFSWDNSNPARDSKGNIIHPGSDYQCRCCALPVMDTDRIPIESLALQKTKIL